MKENTNNMWVLFGWDRMWVLMLILAAGDPLHWSRKCKIANTTSPLDLPVLWWALFVADCGVIRVI